MIDNIVDLAQAALLRADPTRTDLEARADACALIQLCLIAQCQSVTDPSRDLTCDRIAWMVAGPGLRKNYAKPNGAWSRDPDVAVRAWIRLVAKWQDCYIPEWER